MICNRYVRAYAEAFHALDRDVWNYEDGCVLIGLEGLHSATGDPYFLGVIRDFIDRYAQEDGVIRKYVLQEYNLDFIPSGRVLFLLHRLTGQEKYRRCIETLMEQIRRQPRTQSGSFWHKAIYPNQVWLDGLYMALPFYTLYENTFGAGRYDDIVLQFTNARKYLFDEKERLYYHAWNETKDVFWADRRTGLSANFWTRAIGWYLMALADVYALLPDDPGEYRETLRGIWKEAMDGMLARMDAESGLFYQLTALPEEPGNYLETSGSLMVAYSLLKGVELGVFGAEGLDTGEEILLGVQTRKFTMARRTLSLAGMCKGAGLGPDGNRARDGSVAYYLSEEIVADEQKGAGALMMAYAQWLLQGKKAVRRQTDRFGVKIFNREYAPVMPKKAGKERGV